MLNRLRTYAVKIVGFSTIFGVALNMGSALAAENVVLKYGLISRSIPVDALTNYSSQTGTPSSGLESLLKSVSDDDRPAILKLLDVQLPLSVVQVDQILKSPIGTAFLNDVAAATQLPGRDEAAEVKALRSAALVSAAEDRALSFGAILKRYPTRDLTVNLPLLLKILRESQGLGQLVQGSQQNASPAPTNRP